jgi:hypothetical protein
MLTVVKPIVPNTPAATSAAPSFVIHLFMAHLVLQLLMFFFPISTSVGHLPTRS